MINILAQIKKFAVGWMNRQFYSTINQCGVAGHQNWWINFDFSSCSPKSIFLDKNKFDLLNLFIIKSLNWDVSGKTTFLITSVYSIVSWETVDGILYHRQQYKLCKHLAIFWLDIVQ